MLKRDTHQETQALSHSCLISTVTQGWFFHFYLLCTQTLPSKAYGFMSEWKICLRRVNKAGNRVNAAVADLLSKSKEAKFFLSSSEWQFASKWSIVWYVWSDFYSKWAIRKWKNAQCCNVEKSFFTESWICTRSLSLASWPVALFAPKFKWANSEKPSTHRRSVSVVKD